MTLKDKILEVGRTYIQEQQGAPATVEAWTVRGTYQNQRHQIEVSMMITTDQGYEAFEVWVVADLDTEEVEVTA